VKNNQIPHALASWSFNFFANTPVLNEQEDTTRFSGVESQFFPNTPVLNEQEDTTRFSGVESQFFPNNPSA